jgi:hypothetical protein
LTSSSKVMHMILYLRQSFVLTDSYGTEKSHWWNEERRKNCSKSRAEPFDTLLFVEW